MIWAKSLSYGPPGGPALVKEVDFEVRPHQLLWVRGPNGIGKSTLLKVLMGQMRARKGRFGLNVPKNRVAVLPQLQNTGFHLPVTLRDVLEISRSSTRTGRSQAQERDLESAVSAIGLIEPRQLGLSWNTASGGERKRTLLTRLLLQRPSVLLLDEPMNHLDPSSQKFVRQAIARFLRRAKGEANEDRAVLLVSHLNEVSFGQESQSDMKGVDVAELDLGAHQA